MTSLVRQGGRSATALATVAALVFGVLTVSGASVATANSNGGDSVSHAAGGSCSGFLPPGTVVGMATTSDDGGYWIGNSTGDVVGCGDAGGFGSLGIAPNQSVVGIAPTPDDGGYWLVAADGGVFALGDAQFRGSTGGLTLNQPIVGMATTPDGGGYWLVAADGGVFSFGDAAFHGSAGNIPLNQPVVGMAATPDGGGYWLVAADGGIFTYGDATFFGSTGNIPLNQPIVGMEGSGAGSGYRLVASDGGVFTFGSSSFFGSAVSPLPLGVCVVSMSNPSPPRGSNETATIRSTVASAPVIVTANFKFHAASFGGATDGLGNATVTFPVGHAQVHAPVGVTVNVGNGTATCRTSFTPR